MCGFYGAGEQTQGLMDTKDKYSFLKSHDSKGLGYSLIFVQVIFCLDSFHHYKYFISSVEFP